MEHLPGQSLGCSYWHFLRSGHPWSVANIVHHFLVTPTIPAAVGMADIGVAARLVVNLLVK
eukprot:12924688-Prorocentrum_lima.AAC.1